MWADTIMAGIEIANHTSPSGPSHTDKGANAITQSNALNVTRLIVPPNNQYGHSKTFFIDVFLFLLIAAKTDIVFS